VAIKIDFLSNTRPAARGVEELGDALEQVSGSLDDVARDAQRSGDRVGDAYQDGARAAERSASQIGDAYSDAARDGERASERSAGRIGDAYVDAGRDGERSAERLERAFQEASDATARSSRQGGDELGANVRRGTDEASEGLGEFRDEAAGTARESAASFDGSAASIGDAFQEVAANAFAGFGPAGMLAGIAAAAGIGIVFAQMEKGKEETEAFEQKVADLGGELIETGGVGRTSLGYVVDKLRELATSTEEGVDNLADLRSEVSEAGGDFRDIASAYAGSTDELDKLVQKNQEYLDKLEEESQATDQSVTGAYEAAIKKAAAQQGIVDKLEQAQEAARLAAEQEAAWLAAGGPEMEAKAQTAEDYSSAVQDAYADAGSAIDDYVTDGVFNLQKYTEESQKQADAVAAYQLNMVTLSQTLSDEALAYIASLGPEAAPLIDAFVKAPLDQQQATAAVWSKLGQTSTDAFGTKVQNNLNGSSFQSTVILNPDAQRIRDYLSQVKTQDVLLRVQNRIDLPTNQGMGVP